MTDHNGQDAKAEICGISLSLPHRGQEPGEIKIAARPQSIRIHSDLNQGIQGIQGTILKSVYLGSHQEYTFQTELGEWFVIDTQMEEIHEENLSVSLDFKNRGVSIIPHS